jgi:pimeloyl-ACP methyl ester carboxylesterase
LIIAAVLALVLVGTYVAVDRESLSIDALRKAHGGEYVQLSDGVTHYEVSGPADGPVVVLIHGGTVPLFAWDAQVPALVEAGFRVLRYTHYGRGYSDRPNVDYDRALYQRQLRELLDALELDGPFHVVGLSFGAATAATFAHENPDLVDKIAFIAPVVDYSDGKVLFTLAKAPVLGEWLVRVFAVDKAVSRATGFFEAANAPPSYVTRFEEQTRIPGFERSLLSMSRSDALTSYRDTYANLGEGPKLVIWGAEDEEIPRNHVDFLLRNMTNVSFVEFPHVGHGVTVQRAPVVNVRLVTFLRTGRP